MTMLTGDQARDHVAALGETCPHCGADDPEGGFVETGQGAAVQKMACNACGAAWEDVYTLTGVNHVAGPDASAAAEGEEEDAD
jgi:formate dehydrogenase maturation protein FdhE